MVTSATKEAASVHAPLPAGVAVGDSVTAAEAVGVGDGELGETGGAVVGAGSVTAPVGVAGGGGAWQLESATSSARDNNASVLFISPPYKAFHARRAGGRWLTL